MLRRCIWELSSARNIQGKHRPITAQLPYFLTSRNEFSNSSQKKSSQGPAPAEQTSGSKNSLSKVVIGSVVIGAAVMATAYQTGYINLHDEKSSISSKNLDAIKTSKDLEHVDEQAVLSSTEEMSTLKPDIENVEKNGHHHLKDLDTSIETVSETKPAEEETVSARENETSSIPEETTSSSEQENDSKVLDEGNLSMDNSAVYTKPDVEQNNTPEDSIKQNDRTDNSVHISQETGMREAALHHETPMEVPKDSLDNGVEAPKSLAHTYSLQEDEGISKVPEEKKSTDAFALFLKDKEASVVTSGNSVDKNKPEDEKVLLSFIEAIHAAERKQAESDAYIFAEEKRTLKEKYEKELKDARARELMYAEEAAILDKELNKEKTKTAATIKMLQEKAEQKLREELQHKEEEAELQLKKVQELAKAELAAAIASEKSSQIEKIAEANLHINALCMAFYARSEEARQTHSIHKLALGTLALEDALSKGLPIRAEVDVLHKSLEGIDKDSLLDLTLSSLPEEMLDHGTSTLMQLNQKFDSLKGTLRHFSLIPAGGGGLLAHTVAHIASSIKMREDQNGDGIESIISKVEDFLVQGKFADAADALEGGVHGTEAAKVVTEWVRQARNRAVAEQALSLLQSYATSITFA